MNFLAHFHLAWPDPDLVAGGLEGDYRKGPLSHSTSDRLLQGVRLHRAIDAFTDDHPAILELRRQFPKELRRYAGILIDLSFDHFLTQHWHQYSDLPLPRFADEVYCSLQRARGDLSPDAQRMAHRLEHYNVLTAYGEWHSVPASAERIGQRFRRGNPLKDVARQLDPEVQPIEQTFLHFYPQLNQFAWEWRRRHGLPAP